MGQRELGECLNRGRQILVLMQAAEISKARDNRNRSSEKHVRDPCLQDLKTKSGCWACREAEIHAEVPALTVQGCFPPNSSPSQGSKSPSRGDCSFV